MMRAFRWFSAAVLLVLCLLGPRESFAIVTEYVHGNGFEAAPLEVFPRIEFIGDANLIFSATGQLREAAVRVFDADGNLVPNPAIAWESALPSAVSITALASGRANVQSASVWESSVPIVARYAPLGLEARGQAVFAVLGARTVLIESGWVESVLGDRFSIHRITMKRNSTSESLNAGDIIASGDYAGIVTRVLSIEIADERVVLEVEPALLTEAFDSIRFSSEGEPIVVALKVGDNGGEFTVRNQRTGRLLQKSFLSKTNLLSLLQCSGELAGQAGVDINLLSFEQSLVPRGGLRIEDAAVVDFLILVEGGASIKAGIAVTSVTGELSGDCEAKLPSIALGWFPFLGPISANFSSVPEAGIAASISASGSFNTEAVFERGWTFRTGVRYTGGGWVTIGEASAQGFNPNDGPFSTDAGLSAKVEAWAGLGTEAAFSLGVPLLRADLLTLRFAEFKGGPNVEWKVEEPLHPGLSLYTGPEQNFGTSATGRLGFKKKLFDGRLAKYLPLTLNADIGLTFLDESLVLSRLPAVNGAVQCSPRCQSLAPGAGTLTLNLTADTTDTGTAMFYLGREGETALTPLDSVAFSNGQSMLNTAVPASLALGRYKVYARLQLDGALSALTGLLPLAPARSIGDFNVGQCSNSSMVDEVLLDCFPDQALRQCLSEGYLGQPITAVRQLQCSQRGIVSLVGIEALTALARLYLDNNQIVDISSLGALNALTQLQLDNNQIVGISPLRSLQSLTLLSLRNNRIVDVSALGALKTLTYLNVSGNALVEIGPLNSLRALSTLEISDNQIVDISALSNLSALTFLSIRNNRIGDISALGSLTALTSLQVGGNEIVNIGALGNLSSLTFLTLDDNQIVDVSALAGLANLSRLYLSQNQIVDISAISSLTRLSELSLSMNQIVDVRPLGGLKSLRMLQLTSNQIVDVGALGNLTALTYLTLYDNPVIDVSVLSTLIGLNSITLGGPLINGYFSITCESLASLSQALGSIVNSQTGCHCQCTCGRRNNNLATPCSTTCAIQCPTNTKRVGDLDAGAADQHDFDPLSLVCE